MIGDAPGDYQAAKANGAAFYPIVPGHEEQSWQRFHDESLDYFLSGRYNDGYEAKLHREFESYLPENPSWKTRAQELAPTVDLAGHSQGGRLA